MSVLKASRSREIHLGSQERVTPNSKKLSWTPTRSRLRISVPRFAQRGSRLWYGEERKARWRR